MIAGKRCALRPWRRGDEVQLVQIADNVNVSRYLRDRFPSPYRISDALAWIALNESNPSGLHFAIETGGMLAGGIGIEPRDAEERLSAEIGYWLGEPFWRRGIMSEAVQLLTEHVFANHDFRRIYADVMAPNVGSMRVLEKVGYTREGVLRNAYVKNNEIYDKVVYAVVR